MSVPTSVLYVGGTGRSGSTVVANALGSAPGAVSVGELRFLWERGILENRLCGCGSTFAQCAFWQEVLHTAFGANVPDAASCHTALTDLTRLRTLPGALQLPLSDRALAGAEEMRDILGRLYDAVREVSGATTIVDSSKLPTYAMLLDQVDSIELSVVHLVRDPRAAAYSWTRVKEQPDRGRPGHMERRGVGKSTALWMVWNSALEAAWRGRPQRYARVRYEDVVAAPREVLVGVGKRFGLDLTELFIDAHSMNLLPGHTVAGNPARLRSGPTQLRLDDEWQNRLPRRQQAAIFAASAPVGLRYGYRLGLPS